MKLNKNKLLEFRCMIYCNYYKLRNSRFLYRLWSHKWLNDAVCGSAAAAVVAQYLSRASSS